MLSKVSSSGKSPVSDTRPTQSPNETKPHNESRLKTEEVGCAALLRELDALNEINDKAPAKRDVSFDSWSEEEELNRATTRVVVGALGDANSEFRGNPITRRHSR